jgi:hypothetical protein
VLAAELPALLGKLSFPRSMRWQTEASFSRPVRWLLALHGDQLVPLTALGVASANTTRLLRNSPEPVVTVSSAEVSLGLVSEIHSPGTSARTERGERPCTALRRPCKLAAFSVASQSQTAKS